MLPAPWTCGRLTLTSASGDLRNVVKSVVSMPEEHAGAITITVNDRDFDVVACNIIILLVAFAADTIEQATDCIIHIWYSAMISESHLDILRGPVRQLVEDVCSKIASKTEDSIQAKTFRFGAQSLRVVLTKEKWTTLLAYLAVPGGLDPERAQKIRRIVTRRSTLSL